MGVVFFFLIDRQSFNRTVFLLETDEEGHRAGCFLFHRHLSVGPGGSVDCTTSFTHLVEAQLRHGVQFMSSSDRMMYSRRRLGTLILESLKTWSLLFWGFLAICVYCLSLK